MYRIYKIDPNQNKEVITGYVYTKEEALVIKDLFDLKFEIDTNIGMKLGDITEEEGQELLHKTVYSIERE